MRDGRYKWTEIQEVGSTGMQEYGRDGVRRYINVGMECGNIGTLGARKRRNAEVRRYGNAGTGKCGNVEML